MDNAFDLVVERGFVYQSSDADGLRRFLRHGERATYYAGFDATATSLHVGNLVGIMLLAHLQRAGHRPIVVVGGGTTMVGDPSGKTEARPILSREEIATNVAGIKGQLAHYLDFSPGSPNQAVMANNADWLLEVGYIEFLRDIGRHFTINQLLQHETYRQRMDSTGLSFIELNYALVQAYDFLHLYREYDCRLQTGGSDQWFNILTGVELIRRVEDRKAFALVTPLISTASGAKMGKTERGAVWLDPERTTPYDFYQYWVNVEDPDVGRFLRIFTFMPEDEIRRLEGLQGAELRSAKETLAFEVTRLRDGEQAAREAQAGARALFGGNGGSLDAVPTTAISAERLAAGVDVTELLVLSELAKSKREAQRMIQQGGAYLGDDRIDSPDHLVTGDDLGQDGLLLRAGKKRYHRIVAGS
jgi:tyrosyl-tRNA synthetase